MSNCFPFSIFSKRNRKQCLSVFTKLQKCCSLSLGELIRAVEPFPKLHSCFYDSVETEKMFPISYLQIWLKHNLSHIFQTCDSRKIHTQPWAQLSFKPPWLLELQIKRCNSFVFRTPYYSETSIKWPPLGFRKLAT